MEPMNQQMQDPEPLQHYRLIEQAIQYIETNVKRQPELEEIASAVGLSEYHFQRLFTRWAGISPKRFMQFLTKEHAKQILDRSENLLEATTKLEDISTMERVHRWVAASYMIKEKPWTGFGPGTFYFHYKNYTVSSFKTYVSDNPERSGIHNYYLMVAVEQGLPGLLFYLLFCAVVMLKGEQIFHHTLDASRRRTLMAALLCFSLTNLLMLMNDFVETDKIGSLFIISVAIIVNVDLKKGSKPSDASTEPIV